MRFSTLTRRPGTSLAAAVMAMALFAVTPASAQTLVQGYAAYGKGDYATALANLQPLAKKGAKAAQYYLGLMYEKGRGVTRDDAEAAQWFRRAADQGHADAQYSLALMYIEGRGVAHDEYEALDWLTLAAQQGHKPAQDIMKSNGYPWE
ncbi:MAG: tetratricopeptide repeat protein [Caulobacter sp.]|nr:tetratricopeptide repeat protein [Caulobacter sp.]